jgi:hypothetical protein
MLLNEIQAKAEHANTRDGRHNQNVLVKEMYNYILKLSFIYHENLLKLINTAFQIQSSSITDKL